MLKSNSIIAMLSMALLGFQPAMADGRINPKVATFEDITVEEEGHISIDDEEDDDRGSFVSGDYEFSFGCMSDWESWYWYGYANSTATTYTSLDDQWNNIVGGGYAGSANYGVAYPGPWYGPAYVEVLNAEDGAVIPGFYITNTAWAYISMSEGKDAKKFEQGDWFKVTATGYDSDDNETGTVEFYLADFRSSNEAEHYIVNDWRYFDLSSLGKVKKVKFELSSTDNGDWGMNTPAYFAFDDFGAERVATFEDITVEEEGHISVDNEEDDERGSFISGSYKFNFGCMSDWDYWYWYGYANRTANTYTTLDDQWNNIVGGGYGGSANYGVAYAAEFNGPAYVEVLNAEDGAVIPGFYITNTAWAYISMSEGKDAKKFEQGDWFKVTATGYDSDDNETGTAEFYLADFRSSDEGERYIVNDWRYFDLSSLGKVKKVKFSLSSTDNGAYGMNTPAYFAFDNFGAEKDSGEKPTAVSSIRTEGEGVIVGYYDASGVRHSTLQKGFNIVKYSNGKTAKIFVR